MQRQTQARDYVLTFPMKDAKTKPAEIRTVATAHDDYRLPFPAAILPPLCAASLQ